MPNVFAMVCEADADFRTASGLVERQLCEEIEWLADALPGCPIWFEFEVGRRYLLWKEIPKLASRHGIRVHGHFEGEKGMADAQAARRALLLLRLVSPVAEGILLIRDDDGQTGRRLGLEQARFGHRSDVPVVVGLAHCKRESWVLGGFQPADELEMGRLGEVRKELGFDPRTDAHELTAKHAGAKRDAKRVLDLLTQEKPVRESQCWEEASLDSLRENGTRTGLTTFLDEVRDLLVQVVGKGAGRGG